MQHYSGEHIKGRRLDTGSESQLVLFRSNEPKLALALPGRNSTDNDMLDYVRSQEHKLKLEKLKWHESNERIVSLKAKPSKIQAERLPEKKETKIQADRLAQKKEVTKSSAETRPKSVRTSLNPKVVAENIDERTRKASQWLHNEQKEVRVYKAFLFFFYTKDYKIKQF